MNQNSKGLGFPVHHDSGICDLTILAEQVSQSVAIKLGCQIVNVDRETRPAGSDKEGECDDGFSFATISCTCTVSALDEDDSQVV